MANQTLPGKLCTLSRLAGSVIIDERFGNCRIEVVVTKTSLKYPVLNTGTYYVTLLRFIDLESSVLINGVLDNPDLTLTADEKWFILKLRQLDKDGRTVVEGTLVSEVRRVESNKGKNINVG